MRTSPALPRRACLGLVFILTMFASLRVRNDRDSPEPNYSAFKPGEAWKDSSGNMIKVRSGAARYCSFLYALC
jgi:hypothetical protein